VTTKLPAWLEKAAKADWLKDNIKLKATDPLLDEYTKRVALKHYIDGVRRGFKIAAGMKR
jgi:phage terminase small subunit